VLGTASFGSRMNSREVTDVISATKSVGWDKIDTANVYGAGQASKLIAEYIQSKPDEKWEITAKYGLSNNSKKLPSWIVAAARFLITLPLVENLKNRYFLNESEIFSIENLKVEIYNNYKIYGKNFKRICLHDPDIQFLQSFFNVLNFLKDEFPDIQWGVSINTENQSLFSLVEFHRDLDFIHLSCELYLKYNLNFQCDIYLYSIYKTIFKDKLTGGSMYDSEKFKNLRKKVMRSEKKPFLIVDVKTRERLFHWIEIKKQLFDD